MFDGEGMMPQFPGATPMVKWILRQDILGLDLPIKKQVLAQKKSPVTDQTQGEQHELAFSDCCYKDLTEGRPVPRDVVIALIRALKKLSPSWFCELKNEDESKILHRIAIPYGAWNTRIRRPCDGELLSTPSDFPSFVDLYEWTEGSHDYVLTNEEYLSLISHEYVSWNLVLACIQVWIKNSRESKIPGLPKWTDKSPEDKLYEIYNEFAIVNESEANYDPFKDGPYAIERFPANTIFANIDSNNACDDPQEADVLDVATFVDAYLGREWMGAFSASQSKSQAGEIVSGISLDAREKVYSRIYRECPESVVFSKDNGGIFFASCIVPLTEQYYFRVLRGEASIWDVKSSDIQKPSPNLFFLSLANKGRKGMPWNAINSWGKVITQLARLAVDPKVVQSRQNLSQLRILTVKVTPENALRASEWMFLPTKTSMKVGNKIFPLLELNCNYDTPLLQFSSSRDLIALITRKLLWLGL
jgi:hypothetical protein